MKLQISYGDFYDDDGLKSVKTSEEAVSLIVNSQEFVQKRDLDNTKSGVIKERFLHKFQWKIIQK